MKRIIIILASIFLLLPWPAFGKKGLEFDNGIFRYAMSFDGDRISVVSWKNHTTGTEMAVSGDEPYFSFMTEHGMLTSEMPLWKYQSTEKTALANGSVIYTSQFKGKGKAAGIILCIDSQFFLDAAMVRERIRLRHGSGKDVKLADADGRNCFRYPHYSFVGECREVMEVRMATFNRDDSQSGGRTYDNRSPNNLGVCHMFHVDSLVHKVAPGEEAICKGPFTIVSTDDVKIISSYEHASQDLAILRFDKCGAGIGHAPDNDDYWFVGTVAGNGGETVSLTNSILRGGYLDGESLPEQGWYETVWSATGMIQAADDPAEYVRKYLLDCITECKGARRHEFYYNTWGLQRDAAFEGGELRKIFNEERILQEIDRAAELGVDLFVFDDGWQKRMGVWEPDSLKLPSGLTPLIERIHSHGMTAGAWISLAGIDSLSQRCAEHPEWIIKDAAGRPIRAQYKHPALDLVSDCMEELKKDHMRLIDMGIRFFKWDAVNTFHSYQPGLHHGGEEHSRQERIDRYNYLLPFYVTRLMKELKEYEPEVEIEIDLTEPERALVGLMPLQYGKFFWMNNGASGYGDYSSFRGKSMRRIVMSNFRWLPSEIFTYASYPHNQQPFFAQRYNVNTSLMAGHGFWGNLGRMTPDQRGYVGRMVAKSKRVLPWLYGKPMNMHGCIGASPEIYWQIDEVSSFGQVFAFSGSEILHRHRVKVNPVTLLGVLNHAYELEGDSIVLDFEFSMPDDSREAFVLGNEGAGVRVISATGWLEDIKVTDGSLEIVTGAAGTMRVNVPCTSSLTVSGTSGWHVEGDVLTLEYNGNSTVSICW